MLDDVAALSAKVDQLISRQQRSRLFEEKSDRENVCAVACEAVADPPVEASSVMSEHCSLETAPPCGSQSAARMRRPYDPSRYCCSSPAGLLLDSAEELQSLRLQAKLREQAKQVLQRRCRTEGFAKSSCCGVPQV